jgi:acyl-coenzyme A synthetase/AMP-(fatty) acid ligase
MKSCLDARLSWPEIEYVLSATAPLEVSLAARAERDFNCPVLEIYGCTESGSLASRRTLDGRRWLLYEGSCLRQIPEGYCVSGPNLPADIALHDVIEPLCSRRFLLHGRHADMVNMAGKRASLEDLNLRLRSIEGVEDAIFIIPDPDRQRVSRLAALVVAPDLDTDAIRKQLALLIDPVFLPRPLHRVEKLPRNETGKLPRAALLELLRLARTGD